MLQSCETLITKINEWQKSILELEKITDKFLGLGDEKIKTEIDATKQEIKKLAEEYQKLAYPELPNGENLFWPEAEVLEEIAKVMNWNKSRTKIKDGHLVMINLTLLNLSRFPPLNISLFHNLYEFDAQTCDLKEFPRFSTSIKKIWITNNPNIKIPTDLTHLSNLESFNVDRCGPKKFPQFSITIKEIWIDGVNITEKERREIKKKYPNAKIYFTRH